jgi:hypothetical protein
VADPVPKLSKDAFDQTTHDFIAKNKTLNAVWEAWSKDVATRLQANQRQTTLAQGDATRLAELRREKVRLEARRDELDDLEKGKIGDKRPDLVELFFDKQRAVVTDITQKPKDPIHNFKTRLYIEIVKAMTGWSDVGGVDFNDVNDQTPLF